MPSQRCQYTKIGMTNKGREMTKQRLYAAVATQLAETIHSGRYSLGDRLPSERDLAKIYDVSRPTVREALIALEVDGYVEIVTGSGVYLRSLEPINGRPVPKDVGPFELLEARALIEGEAAALAALHITDQEIGELQSLVLEMEKENQRDVAMSEDADRRFHLTIASATKNSAMLHAVQSLWDSRARSQQAAMFDSKVRSIGIKPRIDEHEAIFRALKNRNPEAARNAMRAHLRGVANMVFEITESEAIESAKAKVAAELKRYSGGSDL